MPPAINPQDTPPPTVLPILPSNQANPKAWIGQKRVAPWTESLWDGEKFPGGYPITQLLDTDYWTARKRSHEIWKTNQFARTIIDRIISNNIHTGLKPKPIPNKFFLEGISDETLHKWKNDSSMIFRLWSETKEHCYMEETMTFNELLCLIVMEALLDGDILVIIRRSKKTTLPKIQLIKAEYVRSPHRQKRQIPEGHELLHGVELDSRKKPVAYWVVQKNGKYKKIPAYNKYTGLQQAWLFSMTIKRHGELRGEPFLLILAQALKDLERYADSANRKAWINSLVPTYIKKDKPTFGTRPIGQRVTRFGSISGQNSDNSERFQIMGTIPGILIEELAEGEEPVFIGGQGTDTALPEYKKTVTDSAAYTAGIPPEIYDMQFTTSFTASQAAVIELMFEVKKNRRHISDSLCRPIWQDLIMASTNEGMLNTTGLMDSLKTDDKYIFYAWTSVDFYGSIKPSIKPLDQVQSAEKRILGGFSTHEEEALEINGSDFYTNMEQVEKEFDVRTKAIKPYLEMLRELAIHEKELKINQDPAGKPTKGSGTNSEHEEIQIN